jgi:very-short-patch-repair endonuclease
VVTYLSERQASNFRKGQFTNSHIKALALLNDNHVGYLAEQVVHCFGEFDVQGRPISYKVDILVNDARYSSGVIEIDGDIHRKLPQERKDIRRDHHLIMQKLWVEHIANDQIGTIMEVLEKHKRRIDDYGGVY